MKMKERRRHKKHIKILFIQIGDKRVLLSIQQHKTATNRVSIHDINRLRTTYGSINKTTKTTHTQKSISKTKC